MRWMTNATYGVTMAIPDYQTLMLPLLRFSADGNDHTTREAVEVLATEFQLTPAERSELLASGQQAIFNNRVRVGKLVPQEGEAIGVTTQRSVENYRPRQADSWRQPDEN